MGRKDITQLEIRRLPETFNLTDGHAHRSPIGAELVIVENMARQFLDADREKQHQFERDYITAFYSLTGQTIDELRTRYLLLPAASFSLEIVANYLRMKGMSLALTEPCFDSLVNIFRRHKIKLEPIPDEYLESDDIQTFLTSLNSDAICLVSPNNPTGICYTKGNLETIVRFCKEHGKLLIIDGSFRLYRAPSEVFDEYQILQQSGIDFIFVEDSGKTWPAKELKVSILATSTGLFRPIYDIYTDLMYHHSPFTLQLLTAFVRSSIDDKLQTVHGVVAKNRQLLIDALNETSLTVASRPHASVAWLGITNGMNAMSLQTALAKEGVFVLAGNQFYWSDPTLGGSFLRVALLRDEAVFKAAMHKLRQVLMTTHQGSVAILQ